MTMTFAVSGVALAAGITLIALAVGALIFLAIIYIRGD
jgi:hypothetical protein